MNDTTNSIKGRKIVTVGFFGRQMDNGVCIEVYETLEDAEQAIKDWMLEIAGCLPGDEREVTLWIEALGIHDGKSRFRDLFDAWFEINTAVIL
jgi:hypothetical protein